MMRNAAEQSPFRARACKSGWALVLAVWAVALGGCAPEFDAQYGRRSERYWSTSVNGTDVLAEMFVDAGFEVSTRRMLITSAMDRVQTIVWFPDDIHAPPEEVCAWFDAWLAGGTNRTLVYVGRGFDAEPVYFRKFAPLVPKDQQNRYRARVAQQPTIRPPNIPDSKMQCEWFSIDWSEPKPVESLDGPWSEGVDAAQAEFFLSDQFQTHLPACTLLAAKKEPLVTEITNPDWQGGKLIAISNGSFLLNLPLVNHENRKLAGKLVEAIRPAGRLVFLESGPGGPPIDPPAGGSALAKLFGAWPLNIILLHSAVLGIIFCFASWPIFGRPRTPPDESISDFGKHVAAVSQLMQRTRDRDYARSQLPDDLESARPNAAGTPPATPN
ncbi:MAG: hypothetical protein WD845_07540 [Pirellulales bacterium]